MSQCCHQSLLQGTVRHGSGAFLGFVKISALSYHKLVRTDMGSVSRCVKSLQSCLTLCDPMDCSPPGSSVHGILQARILEWLAISYSRQSPWPRDWTHVSCVFPIGGGCVISHGIFRQYFCWIKDQEKLKPTSVKIQNFVILRRTAASTPNSWQDDGIIFQKNVIWSLNNVG